MTVTVWQQLHHSFRTQRASSPVCVCVCVCVCALDYDVSLSSRFYSCECSDSLKEQGAEGWRNDGGNYFIRLVIGPWGRSRVRCSDAAECLHPLVFASTRVLTLFFCSFVCRRMQAPGGDSPEGGGWEQPLCFQSRTSPISIAITPLHLSAQWFYPSELEAESQFCFSVCVCVFVSRMLTMPLWPGWTWRDALRVCRRRSASSRRSTKRSVDPSISSVCLQAGRHT